MGQIADMAKRLQTALGEWAQGTKQGRAVIASNVEDMWNQAYMTTDRPSVIICWMGEVIRGPFPLAAATHRVDNQWSVAIMRGRGMTQTRGQSLVDPSQNADPFFDLIEQAREIIRSKQDISIEEPVDYKGTRPMSEFANQYGRLIDGYLIDFSTASDLPGISSQPPNPAIPQ